jgi:hypothetical protein
MPNESQVHADLSRFADLDSAVTISAEQDDWLVLFSQNGNDVSLRIAKDGGRVVEHRNGQQSRYATYQGLLMSPGFGNLKRLVAAQIALLSREAPNIDKIDEHLPIVGELESRTERRAAGEGFFERIERWLADRQEMPGGLRALVLDGPAGIGKTHLIRRLSYVRAAGFGPSGPPPLLHVQSRGRKLTTLNDLLAGTLNTLRVPLTFDQVPVLARHGLLHVAIDGFDELADPYGYENAWGSLVDFANTVRGLGVLVLSGRDTFIDAATVQSAMKILNEQNTSAAHLRPLSPSEATQWLERRGWSPNQVTKLREAGLVEDGSYALRPFFISEIVKLPEKEDTFDEFLEFPLRALIEKIIVREVKLVERHISTTQDVDLLALFGMLFQEIARYMGDAETDHLDTSTLQLLCEMVFSDYVTEESLSVLRYRVAAFALLEQDVAPEERRFPHSQIQNYFLALNYLTLLRSGSISKSIQRNIASTDFLETFHDVLSTISKQEYVEFCDGVLSVLRNVGSFTQEAKNVAGLLLAGSHRFDELSECISLAGFGLDEVSLRGETAAFSFSHGTVSLLDVRGCDFSNASFDDVKVMTMVADNTTRVPRDFPDPYNLQLIRDGKAISIYDPEERSRWFAQHRAEGNAETQGSPAWDLLIRICRLVLRQGWIRDIADDWGGRFLQDGDWPLVRETLRRHGLLQARLGVGVGGPKSDFYRISNAAAFLEPDSKDPSVRAVRQDLGV